MRVALIAHGLRAGGGISVGKNIISTLSRIAPKNKYFISVPGGLDYQAELRDVPTCESSVFPHGGQLFHRYIYEAHTLPKEINNFQPDVVLCLGNIAIRNILYPQVLLLHNPYYVYSTKHYGRASLKLRFLVGLQRKLFSKDLSSIKSLLCQTATMAKRVRSEYGYDGEIFTIPNAVSKDTLTGSEECLYEFPQALRKVRNKRILFCLTAFYSHKNLEVIVDLFLRKKDVLRDYAVVLTFNSSQSASAQRFDKKIKDLGLGDVIVNVGSIPQKDLAAYFYYCHALFLPTLMESFSSTYLEAMSFGRPILTSDLDFAREVCGNSAAYFNPWDVTSIADAIIDLDAQSEKLVKLGNLRVREFFKKWDDVGEEIIRVLEKFARK